MLILYLDFSFKSHKSHNMLDTPRGPMLTASLLFGKKLVRLADQYAEFGTNQDNLEFNNTGGFD